MAIRGPLAIPARFSRVVPSRWDLVAAPLVLGVLVVFAIGGRQMAAPLSAIQQTPISLDVAYLPDYALRTILRLLNRGRGWYRHLCRRRSA
jgi:NitT/TauT family transport system permease protein